MVEAGYSGTPLPKKLGIKAGHRVLLDGAPDGFETSHLAGMADGVVVQRRAGKVPYDIVVAFRPDTRSYTSTLSRDIARTATAGSLWIAWPKKASGIVTDITEDVVRRGTRGRDRRRQGLRDRRDVEWAQARPSRRGQMTGDPRLI